MGLSFLAKRRERDGSRALRVVVGVALACASCGRTPERNEGGVAHAVAPPAVGVVLTEAPPEGEVAPIVQHALAQAESEKRALLVYVGAPWCEPCQRFREAAERGELNGSLPPTTLLEFNLDRDRERLAASGYVSTYIPLFALPGPDGAASGRQVEGGIKGEGALGYMLPRVQALLAR